MHKHSELSQCFGNDEIPVSTGLCREQLVGNRPSAYEYSLQDLPGAVTSPTGEVAVVEPPVVSGWCCCCGFKDTHAETRTAWTSIAVPVCGGSFMT